jgi:hypothetical protein
MIEAPFGSSSPMWATTLAPGFALQAPMQTPLGFGNVAIGAPALTPSAMLGSPTGILPGNALSASGLNAATPFPFLGNPQPALPIPEPIMGLTAPALLNAVAIRRGQPQGPTNDQEVEDFIYDALELLSGTGDVDVRCESGRTTLTGNVHHKRVKRDVGEIAWAIPGVNDVQNNVMIASRRRARAGRETETPGVPSRK